MPEDAGDNVQAEAGFRIAIVLSHATSTEGRREASLGKGTGHAASRPTRSREMLPSAAAKSSTAADVGFTSNRSVTAARLNPASPPSSSRSYSLLWSLAPYHKQGQTEPWQLSLEGERQQSATVGIPVDHSLKLRFSLPF